MNTCANADVTANNTTDDSAHYEDDFYIFWIRKARNKINNGTYDNNYQCFPKLS